MKLIGIGLAIMATLAGTVQPADARDSLKLVCSALVRPTDGYDQLGLFVHFIDSRAPDGTSRIEWVSTIYQGTLYKAKTLNKSDAPSPRFTVALTAGKRTVYRGTYSLRQTASGFTIHLTGTFNEDPTGKPMNRPIDADLPCVDISN